MKQIIEKLIDKQDLTFEESREVLNQILHGADPVQVGAVLALLRAKGETSTEVSGMATAMVAACKNVPLPNRRILDIVGTGGDGAHTINISTASVVLAAAAGCTVAKAGNRSVSSRCGSADVLETLGVVVDLEPDEVVSCVHQTGIAFLFAPINHPSMKTVVPIRKSLGVRTVFNILGPLTNAAGAQRVVLGVFDESLVPLLAHALMEMGRVDHAIVLHGVGLDEISPLGPTTIVEIRNINTTDTEKVYEQKAYTFDPLDVGIPRCTIQDLQGGDPTQNAEEFRNVLQAGDHTNAKRDAIVLNAGVGIYVYGLADSIAQGIDLARSTLTRGGAESLLQKWIEVSQEIRHKTKVAGHTKQE
jgi:anthranilate phosphoribosyltransferase